VFNLITFISNGCSANKLFFRGVGAVNHRQLQFLFRSIMITGAD